LLHVLEVTCQEWPEDFDPDKWRLDSEYRKDCYTTTPKAVKLFRYRLQRSYIGRGRTLGEEHRGTLKGIMSIAPGQFWKENIDFVFLRNAQQTYNLVQLGVRQDSLTRCDVEETYK